MADAGLKFATIKTARLLRELDETECRRRNALSRMKPGFKLLCGDKVQILEAFGGNEAFLVEAGASRKDSCDWMGVLYPSELEIDGKAGAP
jgi:hypothetical protein